MGYAEAAYWLDVGTPEAFVRGSCDVVLGALPSPALPGAVGAFLVLGDASVAADALLTGGTTVGAGAVIEAGAVVEGSVICGGATIGAGAEVRNSIVGYRATIAGAATVDGARPSAARCSTGWSSATMLTSGLGTNCSRGCASGPARGSSRPRFGSLPTRS